MIAEALWVIGSGGHAKVVIATARAGGHTVIGSLDDRPHTHGSTVLGVPVVGGVGALPMGAACVVAIGDSRVREKVVTQLDGVRWATVVHPQAYVAEDVVIGRGTVIFAFAAVQPSAHIGNHAIVNTAAVIEHDNFLDDYAQVATGARLTGGVRIGRGSFIGAGAVVLPRVSIGHWCTVGAGAVVVRDVADGLTVAGVPARAMAARSSGD